MHSNVDGETIFSLSWIWSILQIIRVLSVTVSLKSITWIPIYFNLTETFRTYISKVNVCPNNFLPPSVHSGRVLQSSAKYRCLSLSSSNPLGFFSSKSSPPAYKFIHLAVTSRHIESNATSIYLVLHMMVISFHHKNNLLVYFPVT